jgi:hypothetical protein
MLLKPIFELELVPFLEPRFASKDICNIPLCAGAANTSSARCCRVSHALGHSFEKTLTWLPAAGHIELSGILTLPMCWETFLVKRI